MVVIKWPRELDAFNFSLFSSHSVLLFNIFTIHILTLIYLMSFQSTVLKRRPGFENICHVTGFVTKDLDTLEERRLVIVRNHHQDDLHLESRPLFRGGKIVPK